MEDFPALQSLIAVYEWLSAVIQLQLFIPERLRKEGNTSNPPAPPPPPRLPVLSPRPWEVCVCVWIELFNRGSAGFIRNSCCKRRSWTHTHTEKSVTIKTLGKKDETPKACGCVCLYVHRGPYTCVQLTSPSLLLTSVNL